MDHKEFPEQEDALQEALTPAFPEPEECPEDAALPIFPEDTVYPDPIYPEEPFAAPEETVYPDPIYPEEPFSYIARLKDAFLARQNGQIGVVIKEIQGTE